MSYVVDKASSNALNYSLYFGNPLPKGDKNELVLGVIEKEDHLTVLVLNPDEKIEMLIAKHNGKAFQGIKFDDASIVNLRDKYKIRPLPQDFFDGYHIQNLFESETLEGQPVVRNPISRDNDNRMMLCALSVVTVVWAAMATWIISQWDTTN